jgi:hypothetical protein
LAVAAAGLGASATLWFPSAKGSAAMFGFVVALITTTIEEKLGRKYRRCAAEVRY